MRNKRNLGILVILLFAGALAGGIAGEFLAQYKNFGWMSFGQVGGYRELFSFSLHPALDLHVIKFGFDFALRVNMGSIIGMILGALLFMRR